MKKMLYCYTLLLPDRSCGATYSWVDGYSNWYSSLWTTLRWLTNPQIQNPWYNKGLWINLITKHPICVPLTERFLRYFHINLKLIFLTSVCLSKIGSLHCLQNGYILSPGYGQTIPAPSNCIKGIDNFLSPYTHSAPSADSRKTSSSNLSPYGPSTRSTYHITKVKRSKLPL